MSAVPEAFDIPGSSPPQQSNSASAQSHEDSADPDYQRRLAEAFTDDITWLSLGRRLLEETIPTLNAQARSLGTSVGWFWTVYSATILASSSVLADSLSAVNILLIAPIFTTLVAFLFALTAQSPVMDSVDLRSVEDIRKALSRSVRRKVWRIRLCALAMVTTAVLIGTGIAVQLV